MFVFNLGWSSRAGAQNSINQDRLSWRIPRDAWTQQRKGALFIIADGAGGHNAGEVASQLAVQSVLHSYYTSQLPPAHSLQQAAADAARLIQQWAWYRPDLRGMATTLTAVAVYEQYLVIAHTGDTKAYLIRRQRAWPLTRDHTWAADALAQGILTPQEARLHPWRSVLTGALGSGALRIDVGRVRFLPGDRLVLLSDGVGDFLTEDELAHYAALPPQQMSNALSALARQRGSADDRSVLAAQLGQAAPPPALKMPVWHSTPAVTNLGTRVSGLSMAGTLALILMGAGAGLLLAVILAMLWG